jgi:hypothetical protein
MRHAAAVCGLAAAAWALAVPLLGGALEPGYSQVAQFISELGARGAAHARAVAVFGFAPIGALMLAFLAAVSTQLPPVPQTRFGLAALSMVGLAYLVSAVFPCDAGCPSQGSHAQAVHNLFGLLEYTGAFIGLRVLATGFRSAPEWRGLAPLTGGAAIVVAAGFVAMLSPGLEWCRGLSQRVAELAIFGWVALVGLHLLRRDPGAAANPP